MRKRGEKGGRKRAKGVSAREEKRSREEEERGGRSKREKIGEDG